MTVCRRADLRAMPPELAPFPTRTPRVGAVGGFRSAASPRPRPEATHGSILIPALAFTVVLAALRKWWR